MGTWQAKIAKLAAGGYVDQAVLAARKAAIKGDPNVVAAYLVDLGIKVSRTSGLHVAALSFFETASELAVGDKGKRYANYNVSVCLTVIGDTYGQAGQLKKAEESLARAVTYYPGFFLAQKSYGRALLFRGKKKKAEAHLKQALLLDAADAETHALYGLSLENLNQNKKALNHFREAVKLDPKNAGFRAFLGTCLMNQGYSVEAEAEFKTALELEPDHLLGHYHYGILMARHSRWSEAEDQLVEGVPSRPNLPKHQSLVFHGNSGKPSHQAKRAVK